MLIDLTPEEIETLREFTAVYMTVDLPRGNKADELVGEELRQHTLDCLSPEWNMANNRPGVKTLSKDDGSFTAGTTFLTGCTFGEAGDNLERASPLVALHRKLDSALCMN